MPDEGLLLATLTLVLRVKDSSPSWQQFGEKYLATP